MFFKKSQTENLSNHPELYGTYKGFSPTAQSVAPKAIILGELRVIIDATGIKTSYAGSKADARLISLEKLQKLTPEKIAELIEADFLKPKNNVYAFQVENNGLIFIFMPAIDGSHALDLIIRGNPLDCIGITMALGPKNIQNGTWQKVLTELEEKGGPLLERDENASSQSGMNCCNIM